MSPLRIRVPRLSLMLAVWLAAAGRLPAAEVGLRFHWPHEVASLIAEPTNTFPVTAGGVDVIQYPVDQHDPALAVRVREKFRTPRLTEEWIISQPVGAVTEASFDPLVRRLRLAEQAGWEWGDLIVYREPSFDFSNTGQELHPGPWEDLRLISDEDVATLRSRLAKAHAAGELKRPRYSVCGLIYAWKNVGPAGKAFIRRSLDGVYVELNTEGGKWRVDGTSDVFDGNYTPGQPTRLGDFGLPGTRDTAEMARWCLQHGVHFGVTSGGNVRDVWFQPMFEDFKQRCRDLAVDPGAPSFLYLLHHNLSEEHGATLARQGHPHVKNGRLPYFPESEKDSMSHLARYLIESVGRHRGSPASRTSARYTLTPPAGTNWIAPGSTTPPGPPPMTRPPSTGASSTAAPRPSSPGATAPASPIRPSGITTPSVQMTGEGVEPKPLKQ